MDSKYEKNLLLLVWRGLLDEEMETSDPLLQKMDSANNLNELGSRLSSQVSRLESSLVGFLILAL